jgi:hypothetical protein
MNWNSEGDTNMPYDQKCYELAEHFLDDSASVKRVSDLAQHIQDCIEGWLEYEPQALVDEYDDSNDDSKD